MTSFSPFDSFFYFLLYLATYSSTGPLTFGLLCILNTFYQFSYFLLDLATYSSTGMTYPGAPIGIGPLAFGSLENISEK